MYMYVKPLLEGTVLSHCHSIMQLVSKVLSSLSLVSVRAVMGVKWSLIHVSPVWNLGAVIWFYFSLSSLVFLPVHSEWNNVHCHLFYCDAVGNMSQICLAMPWKLPVCLFLTDWGYFMHTSKGTLLGHVCFACFVKGLVIPLAFSIRLELELEDKVQVWWQIKVKARTHIVQNTCISCKQVNV